MLEIQKKLRSRTCNVLVSLERLKPEVNGVYCSNNKHCNKFVQDIHHIIEHLQFVQYPGSAAMCLKPTGYFSGSKIVASQSV